MSFSTEILHSHIHCCISYEVLVSGLDGCFVKLNTGQQILAATDRDGNINIYPLAFGVVEKEDTPTWCWFLTQLKIVLGGEEGQFGKYTIISDRQKVCNVVNCLSNLISLLH